MAKAEGKKCDVEWALVRREETDKELADNPLSNKLQIGYLFIVLTSNIFFLATFCLSFSLTESVVICFLSVIS
jgi:hypothetical protein